MWFLSIAAAQTWVPGATLDDALHLQMPPEGLDAAVDIAAEVIPDDPFDIPTVAGGTLGDGFPGCLNDYGYDISQGWVEVALQSAEILPNNGTLTLNATLEVTVNTAADPIVMELGAACVEGDCNAHVDPFLVDVVAPITLDVVAGNVRAEIGNVSVSDDLTGANVHVEDCTAGSIIDAISFIYDPYDLLVDLARDEALAQIPGFVADLQDAIDDALSVARFNDELDLLGMTIELDFEPQDITVTGSGVDIQISGRVHTDDADPCIAAYDLGSWRTDGPAPSVNSLSPSAHVGTHVSFDIVDQGLYTLWRGGLLCQTLEGGEVAGFSLDTNLLTLLGGESYEALFPETQPLEVRTTPTQSPRVVPSTTHDLGVRVDDLGIDMFSELDGRMAHVLGLTVSPEVGLDTTFSNIFGTLEVDITLPESYQAELRGDPIVPDAAEVVEDVEGVIATVAETALTAALGNELSFELPTYDSPNGPNFGLRDLEVRSAGSGWISGEAEVGTVTYNASQGCDEGCQGSTGCSSGQGAATWMGLLVLVALRRRERR